MFHTPQPTREEFASYWKDYDTFSWRQLVPYLIYLGGLALYAAAVLQIDVEGRFLVVDLLGATAYLSLLPYSWIRWVQKRKSQFIRCPDCGDWFGQDSSGAYHGPNPKFKSVIKTGRCSKCGKQIISEKEEIVSFNRCPCCGCRTLEVGSDYEICPVCFWEDDGQGDEDADEVRGGPNHELSLTQARKNFREYGASSRRVLQHIRKPRPDEL